MTPETTISLSQILWFCGGFATIYGVYKIWKASVLKRSEQDKAIELLEKNNAMILKTLLALVNHSIDGNGVDELKRVRSSLEEHIVKN